MHAADIARLTLDAIRQDGDVHSGGTRLRGRRFERDARRGDDMHLIAGKRLVHGKRRGGIGGPQMRHHGFRQVHPVFGDDGQGVLRG